MHVGKWWEPAHEGLPGLAMELQLYPKRQWLLDLPKTEPGLNVTGCLRGRPAQSCSCFLCFPKVSTTTYHIPGALLPCDHACPHQEAAWIPPPCVQDALTKSLWQT